MMNFRTLINSYVCPSITSYLKLLAASFVFQVCVVLLLVCYALAMPTSHETEPLTTTGSLQKAKTPNTPAVVDRLQQPHSLAVNQDSETSSPNFSSAEDPKLGDDIINGKKTVLMAEISKSTDNDNTEPAARKQRFAGGITSADKHESATAPAVTETLSTFSENTESSSQNPEDKHVSSGGQRDVRSDDSNEHNVLDEDSKEDDISVAETIIFRPLFSYRQDTAARRRYFRDVPVNQPDFDYY
jgi:hypothetical protein